MNPEERKLLQNTFNLAEENNKMLHQVRGVQKRQFFLNTLKWIIIIGAAVGASYFVQPFINQAAQFLKDSGASIDQLKNLGNSFQKNLPNMPR
jgi:hypothetical protein